ncbi:alpha/beta hydrolase [Rufibacter roseolus]|uniref:alpha/beta hydrolase n=1 Tax=Rufibacter roseolus TaxID=2817375 RepID=UPI001B304731|nr:alpha/beta fold hydrolase [Rufibacter roseolus]
MLLSIIKIVALLYVALCGLLYFFQEKLIYFPVKYGKDYRFKFGQKFEEISIKIPDNLLLNALLFKAEKPKGVIYYLHGNAGSLASWGIVAEIYTDLQYDVFMLDYRGFGKSEGKIKSQEQFYQDVQTAYDLLKTRYDESQIIVLGYSIGTGPATKLAAENRPNRLILQAPYYSVTELMRRRLPIIPTFILKYKFETYQYLPKCTMPVVIFHCEQDEIIDYESSVKLHQWLKPTDKAIILKGQSHNGMSTHPQYMSEIRQVLR